MRRGPAHPGDGAEERRLGAEDEHELRAVELRRDQSVERRHEA